jgi:hypothetical protein
MRLLNWVRFFSWRSRRPRVLALEKILKSEGFWFRARCAPERTKAQRAAPFGKLENIWLRFARLVVAPDSRSYPQGRTAIEIARARACALIGVCERG